MDPEDTKRPSDALLAALGLPPEARDAFEEALINAMPDDLLVKLTWEHDGIPMPTYPEPLVEDPARVFGDAVVELLQVPGGTVPDELHAAWRRHLLTNLGLLPEASVEQEFRLGWRGPLPEQLEDFLARNPIDLVQSLGDNIAAALFVGPSANRLLIAYGTVKDPLEIEFLIYHAVMHQAAGHLRHEGFDCRLEYTRGHTPSELAGWPGYWDEEAVANDGATCLWDDWYVDGERMTLFSKALARGALSASLAERPLIRATLRDRPGARSTTWKTVHALLPAELHAPLSALSPRLAYRGPAALVRGSEPHVYLLCADEEGKLWKRWIPSVRVYDRRLRVLGKDIVRVPDETLVACKDGRMLINPDEVEHVYQVLQESVAVQILPFSLSPQRWANVVRPSDEAPSTSRLIGVRDGEAPAWRAEINPTTDRLPEPEEAGHLEGKRLELAAMAL